MRSLNASEVAAVHVLPSRRDLPSRNGTSIFMQRRVWLNHRAASLCIAVAAVVWAALATGSLAQVSRTVEPVSIAPSALPTSSLNSILQQGQQLEVQQRWGDALTHYEDALRQYPGEQALLSRQDLAKLNYSLERRYGDRSFQQSVRSLSTQQATALYLELLRKINTHYVDAPPWQRLAVRGVQALELALGDATFRSVHGLQLSETQIAAYRRDLYQTVQQRAPNGPNALAAVATNAARLAEQQLGLKGSAAVLEFATAAVGGLDDYSAYLTSDQLRDVYSQIEGNFVGLGVELKADNGALLIVHVIPGSPAERAGILDGDRIIAVGEQSTSLLSTDEAAALLTGAEGTYVNVTVESPGVPARQLTVRREHVEVPSLEGARIVDRDYGIAYVRVPAFQKSTARDLEAALWDLHRQGMRSLILDLRDNPGGLLTASVELADKFLQKGGIVSTRGRSPQEDFNYQAHYGGTWRVPLVVLINGDSASASEIFAGAIKDNRRGDVVGARSFGKGSVQGIFPLGYAGAGIRLTTALFYSPSGKRISKNGVDPDLAVAGSQDRRVAARPVNGQIDSAAGDPILQAGIDTAKRRMATPAAQQAQR